MVGVGFYADDCVPKGNWMKILITGGAGFIASHIADAYLALGHEVVIVDDLSTGSVKNIPQKARLIQMSIADPALLEVFQKEKPDVVNHHAAQIDVRKSVANPGADAQINILGSLNLLEACRQSGVKKVVFASTGGAIYGEQDAYPADESHRTDPLSPYGIAKLSVEKYLAFYRHVHGLKTVILRYANVYGPRQNAHGEAGVVAIFCHKILKNEPPMINGDGKQTRDYVFVEDVVACNVKALDENVSGIFNVGTGIETDVNVLCETLLKSARSNLKAIYGPAKAGEQMRSCLKPGKLQKMPATDLAAGLAKTMQWFSKVN